MTWGGVLENWRGQRALDSGETVLSQGTGKGQTILETEVDTGQAPLDRRPGLSQTFLDRQRDHGGCTVLDGVGAR